MPIECDPITNDTEHAKYYQNMQPTLSELEGRSFTHTQTSWIQDSFRKCVLLCSPFNSHPLLSSSLLCREFLCYFRSAAANRRYLVCNRSHGKWVGRVNFRWTLDTIIDTAQIPRKEKERGRTRETERLFICIIENKIEKAREIDSIEKMLRRNWQISAELNLLTRIN